MPLHPPTEGAGRIFDRRLSPATLATALLLTLAIAFRIYALGRLPGINGDEAWYGVQAERILDGVATSRRTPTGNLPGPIHLGLLIGLLKLFSPTPALLRVPSLICSLVAMALAWSIGRRHFDRATGMAALLLMAAMPVNIAFARFGWDPSDSAMVDMAAAGCALAGMPVLSALAFALALATHPANIFIAPFLVLASLGADLDRGSWRRAAGRSAAHVALLCPALALLTLSTSGGRMGLDPGKMLARIADPEEWRAFALLLMRFLGGDSVYTEIAGTGFGGAQGIADGLVAAALIGLLAIGIATLRRPGCGRQRGVVAGWIASVAAFFLLAGHDAISPPLLRYACVLVAPTVLALAVLIGETSEVGAHPARPRWLAGGLAALMLASFGLCYLRPLATIGHGGRATFMTGPIEPKQAALDRILAAANGAPVEIVAPSWWSYWALAYLAHGKPATVLGRVPPPGAGRYWVVYAGDADDQRLATTPDARPRWTIAGGGRPDLLRIWQSPAGAQ